MDEGEARVYYFKNRHLQILHLSAGFFRNWSVTTFCVAGCINDWYILSYVWFCILFYDSFYEVINTQF